MPIPLLATDTEEDELIGPPAPDPNNNLLDPTHGFAAEYFEIPDPKPGFFYPVLAVAFDERDIGYLEAVSRWGDEPSEDARDWGIWGFHPSFTNNLTED